MHALDQALSENAVEHAGDIAEALQEKLSVCLRLDRPNGDRGVVKSTHFWGTLWTLDEAFLVAICLCYQYLAKTLAHWWSVMFFFQKGWRKYMDIDAGKQAWYHIQPPPKKKDDLKIWNWAPQQCKIESIKDDSVGNDDHVFAEVFCRMLWPQRFFFFSEFKCRKAHRTLSSRHACKQAYCANHCKVHLPFFLLQFEMTGLRVQNQMEHQLQSAWFFWLEPLVVSICF